MSDRYGIPDNMFGPVPEAFYALIGRVSMVAAMLEDCLLGLLWALDDAPQAVAAGWNGSQLTKRCRLLAADLDTTPRADLTELLDSIEEARARRNGLVHSLWPNPTLDHAKGWRNVRKNQRIEPWDPAEWIQTSEADMTDLVQTMIRLSDRCDLMAALAGGPKPWNTSARA